MGIPAISLSQLKCSQQKLSHEQQAERRHNQEQTCLAVLPEPAEALALRCCTRIEKRALNKREEQGDSEFHVHIDPPRASSRGDRRVLTASAVCPALVTG